MDYYNKYKKYKMKYEKLKLSIKETAPTKDDKFDKEFEADPYKNIMKLEFVHDLTKNKVKNNTYYDLIKSEELKIPNDVVLPKDVEGYLKNQLDDLEKGTLKKYMIKENNINEKLNLSEYAIVFDNLTFRQNIIMKIVNIFGITDYYQTFIGNCEDFNNSKEDLNDDSNEDVKKISSIYKQFLDENGELKQEFLEEAVLIGFLPKSKNYLLKFQNFNKIKQYKDSILDELKLLLKFCKEVNDVKDKLKFTGANVNFQEDLIKLIPILNNLINEKDDSKKSNIYAKHKDKIASLVFSMKEARDGFYIKEITNLQKDNKKIIFITTDKILTFRCILSNISVINILNGMIRYLAIFTGKQMRIIGNPFEIYNNKTKIPTKEVKDIIKTIIDNPLLSMKRTEAYLSKYLIEQQNKLDDLNNLRKNMSKFVEDANNEIMTKEFKYKTSFKPQYYEENKKMMDILYLSSFGIDSKEDLSNALGYIGKNIEIDPIENKYNYVLNLIGGLNDYEDNEYGTIELDTYKFLFIYGVCDLGAYLDLHQCAVLVRKYLPQTKFNYKQIYYIYNDKPRSKDERKELNQVMGNYYDSD